MTKNVQILRKRRGMIKADTGTIVSSHVEQMSDKSMETFFHVKPTNPSRNASYLQDGIFPLKASEIKEV